MKLLITTTLFFALHYLSAQNTHILPFTGLRYTENGISVREIKVELDEESWTNNQLTTTSTFKIQLVNPTGLKADDDNYYHPNIRVTMINMKGDTLGHAEKFMGDNDIYDKYSLKSLSLTLRFNAETPKEKYLVKATFYDQLSSNNLDVMFYVDLMEKVDAKPLGNTTYSAASYKGYNVKSSDFEFEDVILGDIDSLKYTNKIVIPISMVGIVLPEAAFADKSLFSISYLTETTSTDIGAISEIIIKKGVDEKTQMDVLITIPKSLYKKGDFVRFRWDSKDKMYVLDGVLKLL